MTSKEKIKGFISLWSSLLNIPKIEEEEAKKFVKNVKTFRGKKLELTAAAILHYICLLRKLPVFLEDIERVSGCYRMDILKNTKLIVRSNDLSLPPLDPIIFVPRVISELKLSYKIEVFCLKILELIKEDCSLGNKSKLACAVYVASIIQGEKRDQWTVSSICNVSMTTIVKNYPKIVEKISGELIEDKVGVVNIINENQVEV